MLCALSLSVLSSLSHPHLGDGSRWPAILSKSGSALSEECGYTELIAKRQSGGHGWSPEGQKALEISQAMLGWSKFPFGPALSGLLRS